MMIKLLNVELKKIFKRKSIYIIWGLMLIFCILNNILYRTDYDEDGNYKYLEQEDLNTEEEQLRAELAKYNQEKSNEVTMYITIKTKLDILEIKKKFSHNSWQYKKINDYLYEVLYRINHYTYIDINAERLKKDKEKYQIILEKLKQNDYQYFLNIEIENNNDTLNELKKEYIDNNDDKVKQELENSIKTVEFNLKILNCRLQNNIKEDNSYLNIALENYQKNYILLENYNKLKNKMNHKEKLTYQTAISEAKVSQYIIENKKNINKQNNLSYQLRTILEDYEIFFVILTLIVCSTIICDEFKDGTIKLLLIKPYSRGKILLSKYFTSIVVILITIILLILMQLAIGGIIFGFSSLNIPVVVYDFTKGNLIEYSVFKYMLLRIIVRMPFLLMISTISFFLGILSSSLIVAITMPLLLYMFTPTTIYLANQYNLEFMKYLVNINWNIQDYLFGSLSKISFINLKFSIILLMIYFTVIWIVTYIIFRKKNIKNI